MYLLGIAIGCVLVGMILTMRRQAAAPRAAGTEPAPQTAPNR